MCDIRSTKKGDTQAKFNTMDMLTMLRKRTFVKYLTAGCLGSVIRSILQIREPNLLFEFSTNSA